MRNLLSIAITTAIFAATRVVADPVFPKPLKPNATGMQVARAISAVKPKGRGIEVDAAGLSSYMHQAAEQGFTNYAIVDIREESEYDLEHIQGAINWPIKDKEEDIAAALKLLDDKNPPEKIAALKTKKVIVIHCMQGTSRSPRIAQKWATTILGRNQKLAFLDSGFRAFDNYDKTQERSLVWTKAKADLEKDHKASSPKAKPITPTSPKSKTTTSSFDDDDTSMASSSTSSGSHSGFSSHIVSGTSGSSHSDKDSSQSSGSTVSHVSGSSSSTGSKSPKSTKTLPKDEDEERMVKKRTVARKFRA